MLRHPAVRLILAAVLLHLLLILPNHLGGLGWGALLGVPLELPVLLLVPLAAGSGRLGRAVRAVITALLVPVVFLKIANLAMDQALSRPFNLISDISLIKAGFHLLSGAVGGLMAALVAVAVAVAAGLILWAVWWATGVWARGWAKPGRGPGLRAIAGAVALAFAAVAAVDVAQARRLTNLAVDPPGSAFTTRFGLEQTQLMQATLTELAAFRIASQIDPYADGPAATLLDLIDRDVIVVFVESYGRTSLETPLYADLHRATLARGQAQLAQAGLAMASGYLRSPTSGGQSWLAHSTFANGLWIADQTRYRASLVSGRQTLFHLAARAGFRTAAVMPQITMEWPESASLGFGTILAAADLGYRGQPFNWVTMPDQFTFAAMDRLLRDRSDAKDRPRFIQIATGTSHAPWVPVPRLLPWRDLGDGTVFNPMAAAGDTPDVVWRDRDRVRAQYRLAIDYALQTVLAYAALHAEDPPLMIILGDHQAAGFVALDDRHDVPIHVIGPADLVARAAPFAATPGLIPAPDAPVVGLDRMRDLLLQAYSSELPGAEGG